MLSQPRNSGKYIYLLIILCINSIFDNLIVGAFRRVSAIMTLENEKTTTRVAFLGNSIQYFNDLPRFMVGLSNNSIHQDCCFRGGADLTSLFIRGNGMSVKFKTAKALQTDGSYAIGAPNVKSLILEQRWDYIVINDHTQNPARQITRLESIETMVQDYAPLIRKSGGTPVFLMTYAYREQGFIEGSEDLGNVERFTNLLNEGYQAYAKALKEVLPSAPPRIAPVGLAFYTIHEENPHIWGLLYHPDKKHPSPHGSFLIGCVLYCTIFGVPPAKDIAIPEAGPASLWARVRVMQPAGDNPQPFPSTADAEYLLAVAARVCSNYKFSN